MLFSALKRKSCCSPAPAGRERGTLRLLADEAVALGLADSLSRETIRQLLKKMNSSPDQHWGLPAVGAAFVAQMEESLDFYAAPYDPKRPKVNCDETRKQLLKETRTPRPSPSGQGARDAYESQRNGTRNLLLLCEPQVGGDILSSPSSAPCRTSPSKYNG